MRPPSASKGSNAWVRKKTPFTWVSNSASNWASVVSAILAMSPCPALLTKVIEIVSPPDRPQRSANLFGKARERRYIRHIQLNSDRLAAQRCDFGDDSLCFARA